ncbi:MAG: hypothetical protein J5671_09545 [Bacteroidaceae bacterium]|nr:hypothetical protein [Bacteroidaceae bacterium]
MEDANQMLAEQQKELERIRGKRGGKTNTDGLRKVLNVLFLVIACVGLFVYFMYPEKHLYGMFIIAIGMLLKIVELFIRLMF